MRLLFFALLMFCAAPAAADPPRRVVSFNLCADQLVLALADPDQIAGLSPYAADPALSVMAEQAKKFPRLDWQAEAVLPLQPELVLTGTWDRAMTRRLLSALGLPVVTLDLVSSIDTARRQILEVADLLGHRERGTELVAMLDDARRGLVAASVGRGTALVLERGGFAAGDQTLAAALLDAAGFRPPSGAPPGIGGFLSLERLLMLKPDYVVLKDPPLEATDQGALYLTHPALRAAYPPERRINLPARYALCGGPALIAAMKYLASELKDLR